jgi:hypothetical protein
MAYIFSTKPQPSDPSEEDNFGNIRRDGSRNAVTGQMGNGIQTTDITGTPLTSPQSLTTSIITINIPLNASSVIFQTTGITYVSEIANQSSYYAIPAGGQLILALANQSKIYVAAATTASLSFIFEII